MDEQKKAYVDKFRLERRTTKVQGRKTDILDVADFTIEETDKGYEVEMKVNGRKVYRWTHKTFREARNDYYGQIGRKAAQGFNLPERK